MKKYFMIAALALLALACTKEEPKAKSEIKLSSSAEVQIATEGAIETVTFNSNEAWTAEIDKADWKLSAKSGEAGDASIKVTAPQNDKDDAVVATLTIKAGTASATVKFTQLQKDCFQLMSEGIEIDGSAQTIEVKVLTNTTYSVKSDVDWITPVKTKGSMEIPESFEVAANKTGKGREGTVTFTALKKEYTFTVKQDVFELVFNVEGIDGDNFVYVGKEGGEVSFTIDANVNYTITTFNEEFPWAPATVDGNKVTFKADENAHYGDRIAYVEITSSDVQLPVDEEDPNGELEDLDIFIYLGQEGIQYVNYSISMYDMQFDTWGTTVISEAVYNGKHYVSNGQELYEINPADGKYTKIDWFCGNGMTQKVITNDDAGNLIVCNHTAYLNEAYLDGYFIVNVVTPAGKETNLITKAAWECGGPFGAHLRVLGNALENAMIIAPVEGIENITMATDLGYWVVANGTAGDYAKVTVSGIAGTWSCAAWSTYPNNYPTVIPLGLDASKGFVLSGMYEDNNYYLVAPDGTATAVLTPDPVQSGNYAYQTMDACVIGDKTYLVSVASTFFPQWALPPVVSLIDADNFTAGACIHDTAIFNMNADTFFAPDWDYGISVAADVALYDAGDGKVGIAFADLNGRCVGSFTVDPKYCN